MKSWKIQWYSMKWPWEQQSHWQGMNMAIEMTAPLPTIQNGRGTRTLTRNTWYAVFSLENGVYSIWHSMFTLSTSPQQQKLRNFGIWATLCTHCNVQMGQTVMLQLWDSGCNGHQQQFSTCTVRGEIPHCLWTCMPNKCIPKSNMYNLQAPNLRKQPRWNCTSAKMTSWTC